MKSSSTNPLRAMALLTALAGCTPPPEAPATRHGALGHASLADRTPLRFHAEAAGGLAGAVDEQGVPTFIWATSTQTPPPGITHEAAALFHARRFATALALAPEALAVARSAKVLDHGPGGIVVHLRQRAGSTSSTGNGVEIYGRELRVLLRPDHSMVALAGRLHPVPTAATARGVAFLVAPEAALAGALSHATAVPVVPAQVIDLRHSDGDDSYYQLQHRDVVVPEHALVRKVLFPEAERLRPAYLVEFYAGRTDATDSEAWRYLLAADDGAVLERHSLTQSDAFTYRVWADTRDRRPLDGPIADWTPHPTGHADWSTPPFVAPSLISMDGFNKNPQGHVDPWMLSTATVSVGNNIDAYTDRYPPDGLGGGDFRATVTGPLTFDRTYDLNAVPTASDGQAMAGIVQAFYDTNWLHDYWYDSGFDEAAGNAQLSNYGRGGKGGDRIHVETQDNIVGGSRDNSNMATPSDGLSPRMQIYVWSGREARSLHATPPNAEQPSGSAAFGPVKFDASGLLVEVDDATFPSPTDACQPIKNDVAGKIALVDRGNCTFKLKAVNVEAAGAIGLLVVNNVNGDAPGMGNGDPMATTIGIPVLSTTKDAGTKLRMAMAEAPVTLHMSRVRDIDREGALDNTVIFHEWGHYLHHRLADCGGAKQCNAMSEGWADFNALHTIARDHDNLDGTFAVGIYASAQFDDPAYFGIRRQPYSIDFKKNGLTFQHISDGVPLPLRQLRNSGGGNNSEVHNAGEVWATMLWEVYVALQKDGRLRKPARSFDDVRRRMADYVVVGHQMEPPDATYTESRDALLVAAGARDPEDQLVMAQAFARRGIGTCADSPARSSDSLQGVVEGFKVQPRLVVGDVMLDDGAGACSDGDGVLDAGERAKITIHLSNGALVALAGASVKLSTTTREVTFTGPTTFDVPTLQPFASTQITTEVALDPKTANPGIFLLTIEPSQNAACESGTRQVSFKINYDIGKQSTAKDDVEATASAWTVTGDDLVWSRVEAEAGNHLWHGADSYSATDASLQSPDLVVSPTQFFLLRFEHRHSFGINIVNNTTLYADGGVLEISDDAGMTWKDLSKFVNPGYGGTIAAAANSAIAGRKAYGDKNFSWPDRDHVSMNFLDAFAGKTVRVRFRLVTDDQGGESGWDIDNISFQGIDNTPFAGIVYDAGKCGSGPRGPAVAGGGCSIATRSTFGAVAGMFALPLALIALRRRRRR